MKDAPQYLEEAKNLMIERGKIYDNSDKERSMEATVNAFNAITGKNLSESEGWEFMLILKQVRQFKNLKFHQDSAEDSVAYSALLAESLEKESNQLVVTITTE